MACCVAWNCSNRHTKGKSFHRFPKDAARRQAWVTAMRREGFEPSEHSKLCADHFEESCFDRTGQTIRLRNTAIPTIFKFPPHLQKMKKQRKALAVSINFGCSGQPSCQRSTIEKEDSDSKHAHRQISDVSTGDEHMYSVASPQKMKLKLEQALQALDKYRKKLKTVQKKNRRLGKKVTSLTELVKSMKSKNI